MPDISAIVEEHRNRISDQRFEQRLVSDPEPARAEAVVFRLLQDLGLDPRVHEDPSTGGADFECNAGAQFTVEVSAIRNREFSDRSGYDHAVLRSGWLDTSKLLASLRSRISTKGTGSQAAAYKGPRVLAIVAEHYMATVIFLDAATELLTGETSVTWDVGPLGEQGAPYVATEFQNAAHIRMNGAEQAEAFRKKHALILLVATANDGCNVVGIANPSPDQALPAAVFARIPVTRLRWPPVNGELDVTWSYENRPYAHRFA